MRRTSLPLSLALSLPLLLATACTSADSMVGTMGGNDLGVTPGGSQDIGYARDIIEAGGIPSEDSWSPEGLFSEHDLPLDGPDCTELLCPRAQAAAMPTREEVVVQVGFGTNITADTFERRPLNLGLAVDISGSMDGDKLDAVKLALRHLADHMSDQDAVSMVAFDDQAELRLGTTVMDERGKQRFLDEVARLESRGSTNIESGLQLAYDQVAPAAGPGAPEDRVMLFTDAQPNVANTSASGFMGMARHYADDGIGLTVFGTGLDLGAGLADQMSQVRGGAYIYLPDRESIAGAFDVDFDYMVTPLAYDLQVQLTTAPGWRFVGAVGAPMDEAAGGTDGIDFGASTLFLSSGGGGMAVILARAPGAEGAAMPAAGDALAGFDLRYTKADDSGDVQESLDLAFDGGEAWSNEELGDTSPLADDLGVYEMAFLLDEVDALAAAGRFCDGSVRTEDASRAVTGARDRLDAGARQLDDAGLAEESRLMQKLSSNLSHGTQACQ